MRYLFTACFDFAQHIGFSQMIFFLMVKKHSTYYFANSPQATLKILH